MNGIESEGCLYLTEAPWYRLIKISIGILEKMIERNPIGDEGCKYLSHSKWPNLMQIDLCNILY